MEKLIDMFIKKFKGKTVKFHRPEITIKIDCVEYSGSYDTKGVYVSGEIIKSNNQYYPIGEHASSIWLTDWIEFEILKQ